MTQTFVHIILEGPGGELDRRTVWFDEGRSEHAAIHAAMQEAILDWTLAIGDTIRIVEG
jgi:hypothetical protein